MSGMFKTNARILYDADGARMTSKQPFRERK